MNLIELSKSDNIKFDRFVAEHPSGSFLQSWQWGQWQEQLGRQPTRVMITEGGHILLAAQVIKMPIAGLKKYYLYVPYGPLLTNHESRITNQVMDFFVSELMKEFPDAIFIRLEPKEQLPTTNYKLQTTSHIQPGKTLLLDLAQSEDELLAAMHSKTRYNIRVAQRHGVVVQSELIVTPGHGLLLKEVVDLLVQTATRQGYKSFPASYYRDLINFFGLQVRDNSCRLTIYKALTGTELLAAALMIDFGTTRNYLFGGTSGTRKEAMAPYILHWQAIVDAKKQDLKHYDFWGIETASGKTPGFVRFKLGWGGIAQQYPDAVDIVQQPLWYTVYKVLRSINRKF